MRVCWKSFDNRLSIFGLLYRFWFRFTQKCRFTWQRTCAQDFWHFNNVLFPLSGEIFNEADKLWTRMSSSVYRYGVYYSLVKVMIARASQHAHVSKILPAREIFARFLYWPTQVYFCNTSST